MPDRPSQDAHIGDAAAGTTPVDVYNRLGRPIPIDWGRVWWGTDNCMSPKEGLAFAKKRLREAGCPKAKIASVLGGCARRALKLD